MVDFSATPLGAFIRVFLGMTSLGVTSLGSSLLCLIIGAS